MSAAVALTEEALAESLKDHKGLLVIEVWSA